MLSTKLLPEMEMDENVKREQLLHGMLNLPVSAQIEMLKIRIDMIGADCENAEKILAETRKAYSVGSRQGSAIVTLDKVQAAKIQEQENLLVAAVNSGEGLRLPGDQRQITPALPQHLVDVLAVIDGVHSFTDGSYLKSAPLSSSNINNQSNLLQVSGAQTMRRSAASPSNATMATSFDNATTSPLPYANSPRSGTSIMNTPSPQQQTQQQQQQQQKNAKQVQS